jgi:hypothetical protein
MVFQTRGIDIMNSLRNNIMTKNELKELKSLLEIFNERCQEICQYLSKIDNDYKNLTSFDIWDNKIHGEGYSHTLGYIGKSFPTRFIYAPDSEIEEYVNDILIKKYEEHKERERKNKENIEKREREELARLKAKYGE